MDLGLHGQGNFLEGNELAFEAGQLTPLTLRQRARLAQHLRLCKGSSQSINRMFGCLVPNSLNAVSLVHSETRWIGS